MSEVKNFSSAFSRIIKRAFVGGSDTTAVKEGVESLSLTGRNIAGGGEGIQAPQGVLAEHFDTINSPENIRVSVGGNAESLGEAMEKLDIHSDVIVNQLSTVASNQAKDLIQFGRENIISNTDNTISFAPNFRAKIATFLDEDKIKQIELNPEYYMADNMEGLRVTFRDNLKENGYNMRINEVVNELNNVYSPAQTKQMIAEVEGKTTVEKLKYFTEKNILAKNFLTKNIDQNTSEISKYTSTLEHTMGLVWTKMGKLGLHNGQKALEVYAQRVRNSTNYMDRVKSDYVFFTKELAELGESKIEALRDYHQRQDPARLQIKNGINNDNNWKIEADYELVKEINDAAGGEVITDDMLMLSNKYVNAKGHHMKTMSNVIEGTYKDTVWQSWDVTDGSMIDRSVFDKSYSNKYMGDAGIFNYWPRRAKQEYVEKLHSDHVNLMKASGLDDQSVSGKLFMHRNAESELGKHPEWRESALVEIANYPKSLKTVMNIATDDALDDVARSVVVVDQINIGKDAFKVLPELKNLKDSHDAKVRLNRDHTDNPAMSVINYFSRLASRLAVSALSPSSILFNALGMSQVSPNSILAFIENTARALPDYCMTLGKVIMNKGNLKAAIDSTVKGQRDAFTQEVMHDYFNNRYLPIDSADLFDDDVANVIRGSGGHIYRLKDDIKKIMVEKSMMSAGRLTGDLIDTITDMVSIPYQISDIASRQTAITVLVNETRRVIKKHAKMYETNRPEAIKNIYNDLAISTIANNMDSNTLINMLGGLNSERGLMNFTKEYVEKMVNHTLFNYKDKARMLDLMKQSKVLTPFSTFLSYPLYHTQVIGGIVKSAKEGDIRPLARATAITLAWYGGFNYLAGQAAQNGNEKLEEFANYGIGRTPYTSPTFGILDMAHKPISGIGEYGVSMIELVPDFMGYQFSTFAGAGESPAVWKYKKTIERLKSSAPYRSYEKLYEVSDYLDALADAGEFDIND